MHATETDASGKPDHKERLTILVAGQEGDVEKVRIAPTDTLALLLGEGLDELYPGQGKSAADYDLLIGGVVVTDLTQTVEAAGLHDESEVVIAPKDVSRG